MGQVPDRPRGQHRGAWSTAAATLGLLLAGYDAPQRHIADGSYHVALGASGTALLHTVAVSLGERFSGE